MAKKVLDAAVQWVGTATVSKMIGSHKVTIWRWVKAGTFPAPVFFRSQRRWNLAVVEAWIAAQIAAPHVPRVAPVAVENDEPEYAATIAAYIAAEGIAPQPAAPVAL